MKSPLGALVVTGALILAIDALAQDANSPPPAQPIQTTTAPASPVSPTKRYACRAASQKFQGQERADQMQLCLAQARLDCLKQAIDQKIVGPQRREFVQSCVGQLP
jgi:hypothetical protein